MAVDRSTNRSDCAAELAVRTMRGWGLSRSYIRFPICLSVLRNETPTAIASFSRMSTSRSGPNSTEPCWSPGRLSRSVWARATMSRWCCRGLPRSASARQRAPAGDGRGDRFDDTDRNHGLERVRHLAEAVEPLAVDRLRSRVAIRDVGLMMYTSGTTAMPKGCPLSYEALVRPALEAGRSRFELVAGDRMWDPLPMFHMSFVLPFIACLDAGAALLSMHRFEPGEALGYMERERVTVNFASFPTITEAFLNHPDFATTNLDFRLINNVAPPDVLRSMQARMPFARHISAYGLTEADGVVAFSEPSDTHEQRATTSGRPLRGIEVQIRDLETDEVASVGEPGEILLRGYCLFEGYYKDAVKNAETHTNDGWFRTGDIASLDNDGRISYLGRAKDMLKVGGENVAAASFKIPRSVRFVTEWPMSATKIQKYVLRQAIADGM